MNVATDPALIRAKLDELRTLDAGAAAEVEMTWPLTLAALDRPEGERPGDLVSSNGSLRFALICELDERIASCR